jgi:hypothetical protein
MTRKDYTQLAFAINMFLKYAVINNYAEEYLMDTFCAIFKKNNKLFDESKFRKACGIKED